MELKYVSYVILVVNLTAAKIWLNADGYSNTYALINSSFGGNALELPDCSHQNFGPHITQQMDSKLNRSVFIFHIHLHFDNDRCKRNDRQRVEIKVPNGAVKNLKGYEGETVSLSWNFRLDSNFQVNPNFCSLHQIKVKGGDDALPIITINARSRGRNKYLEVIHNGRGVNRSVLKLENLTKFLGRWIHAKEELTYGQSGKYSLLLSTLDTEETLLSVTRNEIDLWRDNAEYARPKWGIYRSLESIDGLRDEDVFFDNICIGKGIGDECT